jgi:D-alanyl-lipoteichoic acid acyltransferase DltB (MBOAT superfamily)
LIFIVSGFWHGANWTFIIWGALNALYFLPLLLTNTNRNNIEIVAKGKLFPSLRDVFSMTSTFFLVLISWIFFRADSITIALKYLKNLFQFNFKNGIEYLGIERYAPELVLLIIFFLCLEWISREKEHPFFGKWIFVKLTVILLSIITFGVYSNITDFIYFQF